MPIYAKTLRDLCIKRPGRKPKDLSTIHVLGKLSDIMIDQSLLTKYNDRRNPTVTVHIDNHPITNSMIGLGAVTNIMTKDLFISLGLHQLRPTPTVLELAGRSYIKPEGMIEDVFITISS